MGMAGGKRAGGEHFAPERVACLWLPHFPVQVERERRPELAGRPLALMAESGRDPVLRACSPEALAAGLTPGLPAHEVPQRCPGVVLLPFAGRYYQARYDALIQALDAITPQIEVQPPETFYLDLSGIAGFSAPEPVMAALRAVLPRALAVRVGIASGKFTAWAAAHRATLARPQWVEEREEGVELLDATPCALLPVSAEMLRRLHLLGLATLGQLRRVPRSALLAQFGREGERAHRLACGEDREPLVPYIAPVVIRESLCFDEAAPTVAHFHLALARLVRRVCARPERGGRGIRSVQLQAVMESGELWERSLTLRGPRESAEPIVAELQRRLEPVRPVGVLTELSVEVTGFAPRLDVQTLLFGDERQHRRESLAHALEQLRERLRDPAVYSIVEVEPWSRLPEKRHALLSYEP